MDYNPKLKKAMAEIKGILEKYDVAGAILLHTPGHTEHLLKIDTSYSCAFFAPDLTGPGDYLRLRARLQEDFNGDKEKQKQVIHSTTDMFCGLQDLLLLHSKNVASVVDMLKSKFHIDHSSSGGTSDRIQNN